MESIKTQKPASQKKSPKLQPQCVSYSEAASGLLTGLQGTDALANLPGSRNKPTCTTDTHPRGWVRRAGSPRPARRLSFHILSSPVKKEYGPRRAVINLSGRHWLGEICKFSFKAWRSRVLRYNFAFALQQSLYAAWVRLRCISSGDKIRYFDSRLRF